MDKLKQLCAYLPTIGLLVAFYALPYPYGALQRTGLYIAGIGFAVDYMVNRRWQQWTWSRDKWVYVVFALFYLCMPLRQIFDPQCTWLFHTKMETYFAFLVIGVLGFAGGNRTMRPEYMAVAMLLSCVTMGVILCRAMWGVPMSDFALWQKQMGTQRVALINSHMAVNVYCNMTLVFGMWTLVRSQCAKWLKGLIGVGMAGVVIGLMISEGRAGQITLVLLAVYAIGAWLIRTQRVRWLVPGLVGIGLLAGTLWYVNPRYRNYSLTDNAREYIWPVAVEMIKEKPMFGWGVSGARQEFVHRCRNNEGVRIHYLIEYEVSSMERFGKVDYAIIHPHNAFLETWMETGVFGLLLFVLCLLLPIWLLPIGSNRRYVAACVIVFCVQGMFESMGSALPPIWIPLLTYVWAYSSCAEIKPASPTHS